MLHWSEYNTLFKSEKFGYFLYNTLSNSLIELADSNYRILNRLKIDSLDGYSDMNPEFFDFLKNKYVLVPDEEEKKILMGNQYHQNCYCYGQKELNLTLCPTLACNFKCSYCFENSQHQTTVMSDETIDNLVTFIKKRAGSGVVNIVWFGGEPTLAFGTIQKVTRRILDQGLNLVKAQIITNGYLLDTKKLQMLNDLNISSVQISLDGPSEIHNPRRPLREGQPTFDRIIANIDALMNSSYDGECLIRVNVDKSNMEYFTPLYDNFMNRYNGKKITVYAAMVKGPMSSNLSRTEWAEYCIDLYEKHDIITKYMIYPRKNDSGVCLAHHINSFAVGPLGELYKCWEDVGKPEKTIGNINNEEPITNYEIPIQYALGTDKYEDEECRKCTFLPICADTCPKNRMEAKSSNYNGAIDDGCTHFKDYIVKCMEIVYDIYKTSEISRNLLNKMVTPLSENGYRIIYPQKKGNT